MIQILKHSSSWCQRAAWEAGHCVSTVSSRLSAQLSLRLLAGLDNGFAVWYCAFLCGVCLRYCWQAENTQANKLGFSLSLPVRRGWVAQKTQRAEESWELKTRMTVVGTGWKRHRNSWNLVSAGPGGLVASLSMKAFPAHAWGSEALLFSNIWLWRHRLLLKTRFLSTLVLLA